MEMCINFSIEVYVGMKEVILVKGVFHNICGINIVKNHLKFHKMLQ
ncbi:hypothetical protein SAMN05660242_0357 [Thermoanaerobacterium sp. RBIITD]|nr:hypothetical protein SAMN05660242_0357 [Thermoanaerobacterium sp. RBIITD]